MPPLQLAGTCQKGECSPRPCRPPCSNGLTASRQRGLNRYTCSLEGMFYLPTRAFKMGCNRGLICALPHTLLAGGNGSRPVTVATKTRSVCFCPIQSPLSGNSAGRLESIVPIRPPAAYGSLPSVSVTESFSSRRAPRQPCTRSPSTKYAAIGRDKAGRPLVRGPQRGVRCTPCQVLRAQQRSTKTIADVRDGIACVADRSCGRSRIALHSGR